METKVKKIVTEFLNRKWSLSSLHKLLAKFHQTSNVDVTPVVVKCVKRKLLRTLF